METTTITTEIDTAAFTEALEHFHENDHESIDPLVSLFFEACVRAYGGVIPQRADGCIARGCEHLEVERVREAVRAAFAG